MGVVALLSEADIRIMAREHYNLLATHSLPDQGREFYKTRYDLLLFILEAEGVTKEPPTNNSTLPEYDKAFMKKTRD